jgi:hypothetical protein
MTADAKPDEAPVAEPAAETKGKKKAAASKKKPATKAKPVE